MDEEIDPATWRRYLYRVRQYAAAGKDDVWGTSCPDCFDEPGACSPCRDEWADWAERNHQRLAGLQPVTIRRALDK